MKDLDTSPKGAGTNADTTWIRDEHGRVVGEVNRESGEMHWIVLTDECKTVRTGNIMRITQYQHLNRISYVERLPGNQYLIKKSGEIKQIVKKSKSRADNLRYVRQSMQHGRDMVNTNVRDLNNCVWVTLTYAENMTDKERLYNDFKIFNILYRRKVGKYKYINAVEPQGRGAWHLHVFFIFDNMPYIDYNLIRDTWGHGRVEVQHMYGDVNNLGAYLSAYLCNLPLQEKAASEGAHNLNIVTDKQGHMYKKAQRIAMYPANMKIFRYSRGLDKPIEEYMSTAEAEKKASSGKLTFEKLARTEVETDKGTYTNQYYSRYFIMDVEKNQD